MKPIHAWFGALVITLSFVACGDDEDDDGGGGNGDGTTGGSGARGGSSGTGGSAGTAAGRGGSTTGGEGGAGGRGGRGGTSGAAGTTQGGAGGVGGEEGGEGGETNGGAGAGGAGGEGPATCDPIAPPSVFVGELTPTQEVPATASTAAGATIAELSATETQLTVSVYYTGLTSTTTIGHVHGPAAPGMNAPVIFDLMPPTTGTSGQVIAKTFAITPAQVAQLKGGLYYVNIHSMNFMAGEIRAQLLPATVLRSGTLSGDQEVPANTSPGTGRAFVAVLPSGTQAMVSVSYSGLTGPASAGHVHGPAPAGMNAGILIDLMPPAAASGSVVHALWPISATNQADLLNGLTYANVHTAMYTGGEIRAQLLPQCP